MDEPASAIEAACSRLEVSHEQTARYLVESPFAAFAAGLHAGDAVRRTGRLVPLIWSQFHPVSSDSRICGNSWAGIPDTSVGIPVQAKAAKT